MSDSTGHYQGEAGRRYHYDKRGIPEAAYAWISRLRARKFASYVRSGDVVFEFGVGAGWNLASLKCARRLGHDISEFLGSDLARHGIEFVPDMAQVGTGVVSVAICHHALEHVLEPAAVLREMSRLLRPGGTLLVAVPFEKERRYRRYQRDEPNHHLYSWNPQTLANLITETGYVLDSVGLGEFGYDRFAAAWSVRLRLGERGFRLIRKMAHVIRPGREVRLAAHAAGSSKLSVDAPRATEENKGHGQDETRPDFRL